ncbi:MAG: hypothetical protein ACK40G_10510 [Cytophagaceae bacterium]
MTEAQIKKLVIETEEESIKKPKMLETAVSWIFFSKKYVYKIKKPIKTSFLDYSSLKKRQYFCQKEFDINSKYSKDVYMGVVEVKDFKNKIVLGLDKGSTVDYAIKMRRLSNSNLLSEMIAEGKIEAEEVLKLAEKIADVHINSEIVKVEADDQTLFQNFRDILSVKEVIVSNFDEQYVKLLEISVEKAQAFLSSMKELIVKRTEELFFRECHGDLHTGNIFLYRTPILFDALEFSDRFRHIDVINDLAFLCMDLEYHGRQDLSELIVKEYLKKFKAIRNSEERKLFVYYKMYRANVRAKVLCLQLASEKTPDDDLKMKIRKYFDLIREYLNLLTE